MRSDTRQQLIALLPRLRRFAFSLTGNLDEADDLVQAACEKALKNMNQLTDNSTLDRWMFRIIRNLHIDQLRSQQVRGPSVDPQATPEIPARGDEPVIEARQTLDVVNQAMAALPEDQRMVLVLVSVDGLSYREAAEILEVPVGTIMSRLARARRQLYKLVHDINTPGNESP